MKHFKIIVVLLIVIFLTSCVNEKENFEPEEPSEYTIQYTDSLGQHTITVTTGSAYSLDSLPEKQGYVFTGLYDAEEGGTQYVNASGSALSVFKDNKNLILFPQFKPKEYTLVLDYQGADVTGSRSIKVEYGDNIGELPMNLTLENKDFKGWFTKPNREGIQVADEYGIVPANNKVTEKNFNLDDPDGNIYLYAGFKGKEYTVTFYASSSSQAEEIKVEHGTPISDVVPTTRVNGQAVLTWSKFKNGGEVFNGKVTDNMTLYAVEYAPVIEFDCNGGEEVTPIVARAGETIALPTPTKELAKFSYWEDMGGNKYTSTTMPSKSISLKAVWQAKLVFDENGGSDVDDISEKAGTNIVLPMPTKEGFIFAGWYTSEKEPYLTTSMPSAGIALKAGWYKAKQETKIYVASDKSLEVEGTSEPNSQKIDMKNIDSNLDYSGDLNISLEIHFKSKQYVSGSFGGYTNLNYGIYTENNRSDSTLLYKKVFEHNNIKDYQIRNVKVNITVKDGVFFIIYDKGTQSGFKEVYISDYYIIFTYPDTTKLYL